jgi:hypothetical protein
MLSNRAAIEALTLRFDGCGSAPSELVSNPTDAAMQQPLAGRETSLAGELLDFLRRRTLGKRIAVE